MGIEYHFILTVTGKTIDGRHASSTVHGTLMSNGSTRDAALKDVMDMIRERDAYLGDPNIAFFSLEPNRLGGLP